MLHQIFLPGVLFYFFCGFLALVLRIPICYSSPFRRWWLVILEGFFGLAAVIGIWLTIISMHLTSASNTEKGWRYLIILGSLGKFLMVFEKEDYK